MFFLQYQLYGLKVETTYQCTEYPCIFKVECYVSRPMEKTIFLYFMLGVGVLCILINLIEIAFFVWKKLLWECSGEKVEQAASPNQYILGTYPVSEVPKIYNRHYGEPRPQGKVIHRSAGPAPPGYYIPDVNPPTEKYRSPANGFPHIRLRAASFTTSESDVTDDGGSSVGSLRVALEDNARQYL